MMAFGSKKTSTVHQTDQYEYVPFNILRFNMLNDAMRWGPLVINGVALPETNIAPKKWVVSNRNLLYQRSIFKGYVSFREGITPNKYTYIWL